MDFEDDTVETIRGESPPLLDELPRRRPSPRRSAPPSIDSLLPDRSHLYAKDTVLLIGESLGLPPSALTGNLTLFGWGAECMVKTTYKIGQLAAACIGLAAMASALVDSLRRLPGTPIRYVVVLLDWAIIEFHSERLYTLDGQPPASSWGDLSGLYETADGHVRIHGAFPNHRVAALQILGLSEGAGKEDVAEQIRAWNAEDLEEATAKHNAVIYKLRSYAEWDTLPQARAVPDLPVALRKIGEDASRGLPSHMAGRPNVKSVPAHLVGDIDRTLRGLRVLELSRVIAAPVAGRTLAAHGADVLWVTSPNLPDLPSLDIDTSRGKRRIQLDLELEADRDTLRTLIKDADVFIQSYRPGSLAARGFGPEDLIKLNPRIIYASLSAWGSEGPWAERRGFDSIVQTVSGMNVSEAEHFDEPPARPTPCQALDHGAGHLLAGGITAAVYRRALEGGSWEVSVSLAGVMKYLRSLGQWEETADLGILGLGDTSARLEERECEFGLLRAVEHSAMVGGRTPGWDCMPKRPGSDEARWLPR